MFKSLLVIAQDILLIQKNHFSYLRNKNIPEHWIQNDGLDLIMLPAYNSEFCTMTKLCEYLSKKGYKIHFPYPKDKRLPIETTCKNVEEYIKKNKITKCALIGHSKGGIVAKYLVDNHEDIRKVVLSIITINTPFGGTIWASIPFGHAREMAINSKLLKNLQARKDSAKIILNVYTRLDQVIVPTSGHILKGARNLKFPYGSHNSILEKKELLNILDKYFTLAIKKEAKGLQTPLL